MNDRVNRAVLREKVARVARYDLNPVEAYYAQAAVALLDELEALETMYRGRKLLRPVMFALAFGLGVFVTYVDRTYHQPSNPEITETTFGPQGLAADYPHCQSDVTFSDAWSTDLVYLHGVWTAACVAEARRREHVVAEQ